MTITEQKNKIIVEVEKFAAAGTTDCAFWQGHLGTQLSILKRLIAEEPKPVKKPVKK